MANLVYLSGAAMTPFGRSSKSLEELMVEAGLEALARADLETVDTKGSNFQPLRNYVVWFANH